MPRTKFFWHLGHVRCIQGHIGFAKPTGESAVPIATRNEGIALLVAVIVLKNKA